MACLFHFLQSNKYQGPLDSTKMSVIVPDHDPDLRAGQREGEFDGYTLEIKSQDPQILKYYPEMKGGWSIHGDRAIRACKIVTAHDASKVSTFSPRSHVYCANNKHAKPQPALNHICRGLYWLKPEVLPRSIRFELFDYLTELKFDQRLYSSNTVFHAQMFWEAQKCT